jgi:hypothetical protein
MKLIPSLIAVLFGSTLASVALLAQPPDVPDWALPGSATHKQVPPPEGFHRPSKNFDTPIGIFSGQSDVGSALVPSSATYDPEAKTYTITSAGYNIWYNRDEFRFLWKKMKGDVSLAADIAYPNPKGYGDRKAVLIFRQDLDDDSKEAMVALHGAGLIHLAGRLEKNGFIKEQCRLAGPANIKEDALPTTAQRIGIEKKGDTFTLYISEHGEPLHPYGTPLTLHLQEPFYVGIAFCSHLPATADTAIISNVVLKNKAGKVR